MSPVYLNFVAVSQDLAPLIHSALPTSMHVKTPSLIQSLDALQITTSKIPTIEDHPTKDLKKFLRSHQHDTRADTDQKILSRFEYEMDRPWEATADTLWKWKKHMKPRKSNYVSSFPLKNGEELFTLRYQLSQGSVEKLRALEGLLDPLAEVSRESVVFWVSQLQTAGLHKESNRILEIWDANVEAAAAYHEAAEVALRSEALLTPYSEDSKATLESWIFELWNDDENEETLREISEMVQRNGDYQDEILAHGHFSKLASALLNPLAHDSYQIVLQETEQSSASPLLAFQKNFEQAQLAQGAHEEMKMIRAFLNPLDPLSKSIHDAHMKSLLDQGLESLVLEMKHNFDYNARIAHQIMDLESKNLPKLENIRLPQRQNLS